MQGAVAVAVTGGRAAAAGDESTAAKTADPPKADATARAVPAVKARSFIRTLSWEQ
jgi:hypothetical protein